MTTFDTSGAVVVPHPTPEDAAGRWASDPVQWPDLSPFTQGYIEALFAALCDGKSPAWSASAARYERLAPETLARIIADCETGRSMVHHDWQEKPEAGARFWAARQQGLYPIGGGSFPPLTVQLGDDGKVRFGEDR